MNFHLVASAAVRLLKRKRDGFVDSFSLCCFLFLFIAYIFYNDYIFLSFSEKKMFKKLGLKTWINSCWHPVPSDCGEGWGEVREQWQVLFQPSPRPSHPHLIHEEVWTLLCSKTVVWVIDISRQLRLNFFEVMLYCSGWGAIEKGLTRSGSRWRHWR